MLKINLMKTNKKDIAIIDYGCSNIKSIISSIEFNNYRPILTNDINELKKYKKIIFPGVGNFGFAMKKINKIKLKNFIKNHVEQNNYLLGICLGMQLLLKKSEESPKINGIEIFDNNVKKLESNKKNESFPHISWKRIHAKSKSDILSNLNEKDVFYFTHSFFCNVTNKKNILAFTKYNNKLFPSIINYKKCFGVQFHPEKSKSAGLKLIKNFLEM